VTRPSISVFFPCYNDGETIGDLVLEAERQLRQLSDDFEIIVVNDGSRDNSADVLSSLQRRVGQLKVITHERNRGYGGALRSGFGNASKDFVFYTDGDGQYDVRELPVLLMLMTDDTHFVNGIKMNRQDPAYRIHFGNVHKFLMRWAFWLPVTDVNCDFRLIRRAILDRMTLTNNSGAICVELVKNAQRAGAEFREVSVHHYARRFGQSQFFRPGRIIRTYIELAQVWFQLMVKDQLRPRRAVQKGNVLS
jgi:glycosyltransferase involved in cell wall biosynthesis